MKQFPHSLYGVDRILVRTSSKINIMSYEPRLYIGKVHRSLSGQNNDDKFFFEQFACVHVPGPLFENNYLDEDDVQNPCYLFLDGDGDTEVIDDKYDRHLYVIPAIKVTQYLLNFKELQSYPMLYGAHLLLSIIIKELGGFYDIGVVIYGY